MTQRHPFTFGELALIILFLTLPLAVSLYMIPRAGLYAVVAALAWGLPAGGLIVAAMRRGRRTLYCRLCERHTVHTFAGVQSFGRHGSLDLWNCSCGATTSEIVN